MKTYAIKEIFSTLQGEGFHTGTPAVFIRFVGCNLWSGREGDRDRDAVRNGAECPRWCDTDFVDGERLTVDQICARVGTAPPLFVLTGGEPLLQVDHVFCDELHRWFPDATVAVETNGTVLPRVAVGDGGIDWVCVSPKVPPDRLLLRQGHELKVVFPAYDPSLYTDLEFEHRFVQPEALTMSVGKSVIAADNTRRAIDWLKLNPGWRLSMQTHKILEIP